MTILELLGVLNKTSPELNNKKVLVDVMIPSDNGNSKLIYGCEVLCASVGRGNNIILACRSNK